MKAVTGRPGGLGWAVWAVRCASVTDERGAALQYVVRRRLLARCPKAVVTWAAGGEMTGDRGTRSVAGAWAASSGSRIPIRPPRRAQRTESGRSERLLFVQAVTARSVSIPYRKPFVIAGGSTHVADYVLVTVVLSDDQVGVGECSPMTAYSDQTPIETLRMVTDVIGPGVVGCEATPAALHRRMDHILPGHGFAKAGVDLALYDALGKSWGVSAAAMLGGIVQPWIPVTWPIGLGEPSEVATEAMQAWTRGFPVIKLKVGTDPERDVRTVTAVRAALGPEAIIRVDANQGYDRLTARRVLERIAPAGIELCEQPLAAWDLDGLAELRQLGIPIMADESAYDLYQAMELCRRRAVDLINIKLMKPGGLYPAQAMAMVARAAGIGVVVGSMPEFGVGTAAGLQFAGAMGVTWASDLVGPLMFQRDVLDDDPLGLAEVGVNGGRVRVPAGPGLGVALGDEWAGA